MLCSLRSRAIFPLGTWPHAGKHAPGSVAVTRAASTFILPFQDNELLLAKEDASHGGYQFAHPVDVYITPALYGEWTEVPNGRVWTLPIQSAGAKSLSLHFNKFDIPEVRAPPPPPAADHATQPAPPR